MIDFNPAKLYSKISQFLTYKSDEVIRFYFVLGLTILLLYSASFFSVRVSQAAGENLVKEPSFETNSANWKNPWVFESRAGATGAISQDSGEKQDGNYAAKVDVTVASSTKHLVQLRQKNINLTSGKNYAVKFWAKASASRNLLVTLQKSTDPYTVYQFQNVNLSTSWKLYSFTYDSSVTDTTAYISFNFAESVGQIWLDNISVNEVNVSSAPVPSPSSLGSDVSSDFVTRVGPDLYYKGVKTRFEGPNIYWTGLITGYFPEGGRLVWKTDIPPKDAIDDAFATAKEMGANMVRTFATATVGCPSCLQPSRGVYNEANFDIIDYQIAKAAELDLKLVMILVDNYKYGHGGKMVYLNWRGINNDDANGEFFTNPTVIQDFKDHISKVLNRSNKYRGGLKYKDDPTIMAWETGNELYPGFESTANFSVSLACWTKEVADHIKVTEKAQQLVIDGKYRLDTVPTTCASSPNNALGLQNVDIYSEHYMQSTAIGNTSNVTRNNNKVYMLGEYGFTGWQLNYSTGFYFESKDKDLAGYLQTVRSNPVSISSYWSLFPHKSLNGFWEWTDGYTLYYPGYGETLPTSAGPVVLTESYMRGRVRLLREHAFAMRGLPVAPHSCTPAPTLHPVTSVTGGVSVNWRGAVGAASYNIERSTNGGVTWSVIKTGVNDFNSPWIDPTGNTSYKYRIQGINLDGVKGDYSDGTKVCSGTPAPSNNPSPTPKPSPFGIPSPSVSASPKVTPSPSSTPTSNPTASPTVSNCTLKTASWDVKTNAVEEGVVLTLNVTTTGNCNGKQLSFVVTENDSIVEGVGDDEVSTNPANVIISGNKVSSTWIAEYQEDGLLGVFDPPEYYFTATIINENKNIRSEDPLLQVFKNPDPVITTEPGVTVDKDKATINWKTNRETSSRVKFGLPDQEFKQTPEQNVNSKVKDHQVMVDNLLPCTTYNYEARSKDARSKEVASSTNKFTTSGCVGDAKIITQTHSNIISATGGLMSLTDASLKGVSLDIPAEYSTANAQFQVKQLEKQAVIEKLAIPSGYNMVKDYVYNLSALTDVSVFLSSFAKPIQVTMSYTQSDLSSINENSLVISRYDGASWQNLSNCVIDEELNKISCQTANFSVFALIGVSNIPAPSTIPSSTPTNSSNNDSSADNSNNNDNNNSNSQPGVSSSGPSSSADLNSSRRVDITDLSILLRNWGRSGQGDLNGSGKVDITDLSILLRNWTR